LFDQLRDFLAEDAYVSFIDEWQRSISAALSASK